MTSSARREIPYKQPAWNSIGALGLIAGAVMAVPVQLTATEMNMASVGLGEATMLGAASGAAIGVTIGLIRRIALLRESNQG